MHRNRLSYAMPHVQERHYLVSNPYHKEVVVNTSDINKNSIFTFFILCIILMYRKTPRNQLLIQ